MGDKNAKFEETTQGKNTSRERNKLVIPTKMDNSEYRLSFPERSDHRRFNISTPLQGYIQNWYSRNWKLETIDHITVARSWGKSMTDVRAYRGADIASDLQLMVVKFKIKIARASRHGQIRRRKYNIWKSRYNNIANSFKRLSISL